MKDLHVKILALRSQGKSYKVIVNELGCSKANISWVCNRKVPKEKHYQQIQQAIKLAKPKVTEALKKASLVFRANKVKEKETLADMYLKLMSQYKNQIFVSFVVGLYCGEGAHSKSPGQTTQFSIVNSDYRLVNAFIKFLHSVLKLKDDRITYRLILHKSMNLNECLKHWKDKGIPKFNGISQNDARGQKKKHLHNHFNKYFGVVSVRVKSPNGLRLALEKYVERVDIE